MTQSNPVHPKDVLEDKTGQPEQSGISKQMHKNALWGASMLTGAGLLFVVVGFLIAEINSWKDYILLGAPAMLFILGLVSIALLRRGRIILGTGLIFVANLIVPLTENLLQRDIGPVIFIYILVSSGLLIWRTLPKSSRLWAAILTGAALLSIAVVEVVDSPIRVNPADELVTFIIIATALLTVSFIAQAIREGWSGNIRLKLITSFTLVALVAVGIVGTGSYLSYQRQIRADIRQRLLNIISITAIQQDGDLFATLQTAEDMQSDAYQKMQAVNGAILATDRDLAYIFSVRVDDQGKMEFVVDSGLEEGYVPLEVGVPYDDPSELLAKNAPTLDHPIVEDEFYTDQYGTFLSAYAPIYGKDGTREGIVGVDIFADKVLEQERSALYVILGVTLLTLFLVAGIGLYLGNLFTKPITNLASVAQQIADGNLSVRAQIETTDEIGSLASTFNVMTNNLQETLHGLEQRIAERTRNLELAAEVGRSVSQVRTLDVMLTDAAELIRRQFDLYYVQVYLVNPSETYLNLQAGTGDVGRQLLARNHRLPLNINSINGRAVIEKKPVVISDTTASATFTPNPLLPKTHSEMAVPLIVGERVVGVLDMQSEVGGSLSTDILPAFTALAGQVAIAIQNANLLAETNQARAEVEAQAQRLSRANWVDYLDAIHKPEETGYVFEQNKVAPLTYEAQSSENAKVAPISVTGETVGNLVVEMEGQSPITRTDELLNTVAQQVARQIENLRLLESAERYRAEAEEASRRITREGWKTYTESSVESLSYLYDLKEVRPLDGNTSVAGATTIPLKVRDEVVGKLDIQGLDTGDRESLDLANAVADRLSAHIESLRQFEETKRGQVELDRRAQQLAAVAEISTVSSKELDIQKMLESVVFLTQRKFGLYHAHVFTLNEISQILEIQACGWQEGDIHEGTHGTTTIPLMQEQSLVARAARTKQSVIVNDVRNEPGWLPNPLLPDTASELAVPLLIGDQVLGVLDVQSDRLNAFSEEDANIQTTLASQVATSLQNARSFTLAQKQAERESTLNLISQKIQSATTVEAVLQIAARELGHALGAPMTIAQLSMKDRN